MTPLRRDAEKSAFFHVAIIFLFAVGLVALPVSKLFGSFGLDGQTAVCLSGGVLRIILSVIVVILIIKYGFTDFFKNKLTLISILLTLPALLVAVNNAPIIGLATGNVMRKAGTDVFLYLFYCLTVGLYEELVFRGLIFPLILIKTEKKKHGVFLAILFSSLLFAAAHLLNLISGAAIVDVLLQMGYSFLIGSMCAISFYVTKNIFTAILLHTVYDIGGLLIDKTVGLCVGKVWDTATVVITVVLGVIVAVFEIVLAIKLKSEDFGFIYIEEETNAQGQI